MKDIIKRLVEEYDTETQDILASPAPGKSIVLIGDPQSQYLRAIAKKAAAFKINYRWSLNPLSCGSREVLIYDTEYPDNEVRSLVERVLRWDGNDIDHLVTSGLSCCAEACLNILDETTYHDALVGITGRGHSQQELGATAAEAGWGIVHAHSESDYQTTKALALAEAIVHTSDRVPPWEWTRNIDSDLVFLDVCGKKADVFNGKCHYYSASEIGALNISILFRRFVGV